MMVLGSVVYKVCDSDGMMIIMGSVYVKYIIFVVSELHVCVCLIAYTKEGLMWCVMYLGHAQLKMANVVLYEMHVVAVKEHKPKKLDENQQSSDWFCC